MGLTDLPDWRIACSFVGKGHRRKGVASAAARGVLELIAGLGGGVVEGYPEAGGTCPPGFLLHGALSTLREARLRPRPPDREGPLGRRTAVP